ncbi:efflux RND transporter permease subunit [Enterovirga rhinocerotis]|uniref:Multidrug efflux pump n=1 Tax=Enterovirga rhinocerotis TaxID=1339210 RepID=A0A4R7C0L3_9HYPH|nr:efflux RND transporter permease subunit [Enterovirga rhinocerotis]TDR89916.1 multidrug efflux pump [Enterovirga rhinocerotis]
MNPSEPFIRRPVATTLIAVALLLVGFVAYLFLPVASMPTVDFPTIRVSAQRPGADPATMASTVAAPLERRLGAIAGVTELTSTSSLGSTSISVQFDLGRSADKAARDVQAALNAAATDLPSDLPSPPTYRKANPGAFPVLILALTSKTMPASAIYDVADTVIAQRVAQVEGVAEVIVSGAEQPAIRVTLDPQRMAAMDLSSEDVRNAIVAANVRAPLGSFDGPDRAIALELDGQLGTPEEYGRIVVRSRNGIVVRLADVATVERGTRNRRASGSYNGLPAVTLQVTRQPGANVVETVDRVRAVLPELRRWIPAAIDIEIMSDRTLTIRASLANMRGTLLETIALVMLVVFLFLRRATPTFAAGITVPLSIAGTFAAMWLFGFTLDNLSLMAITISVGFVVDDAIVMIESVQKRLEEGMTRMEAAIAGARDIGFTVISISLSLLAAFIPLFFMPGVIGRFFQEFAATLGAAVVVSTLVSLTIAPMIVGHLPHGRAKQSWLDRVVEGGLARLTRLYAETLGDALRHPWLMLLVTLTAVGLTMHMFRTIPKGYFPQDDTGLLIGFAQASPDISFPAMAALQERVAAVVRADPAVAGVSSSAGSSGWSGSVNQGRLFVSLRQDADRETSQVVIARLRAELAKIVGIRAFLFGAQDVRAGGRQSRSQYEVVLLSQDIDELDAWTPRILERLRQVEGLADLSSDRDQGGLQATVEVDRTAASRLGVSMQDVGAVLNDAFSQRQISTIYTQRNQYRVILDVRGGDRDDPSDLTRLYVPGRDGTAVPLSALATVKRGLAPLTVNHQGSFPAVTISYNVTGGLGIEAATQAITAAIRELPLPPGIRFEFAGDAKAFAGGAGDYGLLVLAALVAVYIILGVLYESLVHPFTILSTLPSAGLGALIALQVTGLDLSIIALIGLILLIGLVKKNGIMLVDAALSFEREGMEPARAAVAAAIERFRPILMTTFAALLGAVPLAIATGVGAEIRRPLGITIIGGLIVSQVLTLYTTPAIYLLLSRLHRPGRRRATRLQPAE